MWADLRSCLAFVLTQRGEPRPARAREVTRIRAEHLDFEERLETEHDLSQMRTERLRVKAQHHIAERSPSEGCDRVRCPVVSDRLEREPASGSQPRHTCAEEAAVGGDPLRARRSIPGE